MGTPRDRDGLDIEIGRRPFGAGQGVFLASYEKPTDAPETAYQLSLLTYTYHSADSYASVSYTLDLRGKVTRLPGGGLSGQFYGTLPATATAAGQSSTVQGTFRVGAPTRKTAALFRRKP